MLGDADADDSEAALDRAREELDALDESRVDNVGAAVDSVLLVVVGLAGDGAAVESARSMDSAGVRGGVGLAAGAVARKR